MEKSGSKTVPVAKVSRRSKRVPFKSKITNSFGGFTLLELVAKLLFLNIFKNTIENAKSFIALMQRS